MRVDSDETEALCPIFTCANIPVEVHELNNRVLVRQLAFTPGRGGPGQFRGGCGLRKDIELRTEEAVVSLLSDRRRCLPYGISGDWPCALGETILNPDRNARLLSSKEVLTIRRGDIISFRRSGADGYGDPRKRDRRTVAEDVADGFVSAATAAAYGGQDQETRLPPACEFACLIRWDDQFSNGRKECALRVSGII
ncbi:hydantoinase B/oxoprolinase family protein [bacterium]|nr:hydantoinase B/oxoprolinase family protein [bacterium]